MTLKDTFCKKKYYFDFDRTHSSSKILYIWVWHPFCSIPDIPSVVNWCFFPNDIPFEEKSLLGYVKNTYPRCPMHFLWAITHIPQKGCAKVSTHISEINLCTVYWVILHENILFFIYRKILLLLNYTEDHKKIWYYFKFLFFIFWNIPSGVSFFLFFPISPMYFIFLTSHMG